MLNLLFWNVNKKDLRPLVCLATAAAQADLLILIENRVSLRDTLSALRSSVDPTFYCPRTNSRFQFFSRNPELGLHEYYAGSRISLRQLRHAGTELLLGALHIVDRRNFAPEQQQAQVQLLAAEVCKQEDALGHTRTILVGDFNMNPFDPAMNLAEGMNAMMTKRCVVRKLRKHQNREYRFFYNPMWNLFGDRTPGPAGTYYHRSSSSGYYGWNMLDQVLLRPRALGWFCPASLESGMTSRLG